MPCPCGLELDYASCCGQFHQGLSLPATAEELMRSRYTAFAKAKIDYLKETTWPPQQKRFDAAGYAARATQSIWTGLEILEKEKGEESDGQGTVTFIARSLVNGNLVEHREKSLFKKKSGRWYYVRPIE